MERLLASTAVMDTVAEMAAPMPTADSVLRTTRADRLGSETADLLAAAPHQREVAETTNIATVTEHRREVAQEADQDQPGSGVVRTRTHTSPATGATTVGDAEMTGPEMIGLEMTGPVTTDAQLPVGMTAGQTATETTVLAEVGLPGWTDATVIAIETVTVTAIASAICTDDK